MAGLRRLLAVLGSAAARYVAAGCPQHAAGIAYRVLFSLAPLAIVLVAVFGLVLQDDDLRDTVVARVVDTLPVDDSGRDDVEEAIEAIATPASAAGLAALLVLLWTASGMMGAIRSGLRAAMGVEQSRPAVRGKLVDLVLVGAVTLLVLASVGVGLVTPFVNSLVAELMATLGLDGDIAQEVTSLALPFAVWVGTGVVVYRFVPAEGPGLAGALAGSIVMAALLLGISLAADLLYASTTRWSVVYGSLTTILVFLYSVYLYASSLLLGGAVAAEWSRPREPGPGLSWKSIRATARGLVVRDRSTRRRGRPPRSPR